jgi:hypothetical protein
MTWYSIGVMKEQNATREASIAGGKLLILQGLFEILDTHVSMDLKWDSPEFDAGMKQLETLEAKIDAATEKRDFFWSLA